MTNSCLPSRSSRLRGEFLLVAVFVVSRLGLFALPPITSDVGIYAQYVQEFDEATREDMPFYQVHARDVDARTQKAREEGKLIGSLEEYKDVEYPPLALLFMRLPRLWLGSAPAGEEVAVQSQFGARYRTSFMAIMAMVDVALFGLLIGLVRHWYSIPRSQTSRSQTPVWERTPGNSVSSADLNAKQSFADRRSQTEFGNEVRIAPLALYVIATILLWHLLYDRLDLVLAFLIVASLALVASRMHYLWSFALLALAVNFKLVPLVLAPVWVLGSMTGEEVLSLHRPRGLVVLAARSCLLLLLIVGCFLPFYLVAGNPTLGFLTYHHDRGLEIGSVSCSLPLALQTLGYPLTVEYSYGSINVRSPLAAALVKLSPALTGALLVAATGLLLASCRRLAHGTRVDSGTQTRLAQLHPQTFVRYALLFLMLFILTNKIFSPQYLLWLVPLLALTLFKGTTRRWLFWGFLLLCLLSTVLVPFLFAIDLYDPISRTVPSTFNDPTLRVSAFLIARNLLFVVLTVTCIIALMRTCRQTAAANGIDL